MYFYVKKPIKINGKRFIPAVCYEVTKENERESEILFEANLAKKSDSYIVFQNGKPIAKKTSRKKGENK